MCNLQDILDTSANNPLVKLLPLSVSNRDGAEWCGSQCVRKASATVSARVLLSGTAAVKQVKMSRITNMNLAPRGVERLGPAMSMATKSPGPLDSTEKVGRSRVVEGGPLRLWQLLHVLTCSVMSFAIPGQK